MPAKERVLSGALVDGQLVVVEGRHGVYGVDAAACTLTACTQVWMVPRVDGPVAMPAIAVVGGEHLLLFTEGAKPTESRLVAYGLGPAAPKLLWQVALDDVTSSGISVDGSTAFLGDRSGTVYGVNLQAARVSGLRPAEDAFAWRFKFPGGGIVDAPSAVADGKVFAVLRDQSNGAVDVVAITEATGKAAWPQPYSPSAPPTYGSAPTVDGSRVYVGFADQTIRALDAGDGASLWSSRVNSPFFPLTAPAVSEGNVFALATLPGSEAGLYRLNGTTGQRDWWFEFGSSTVVSSPVLVGPYLYVALDDGRLAAVQQASDVEVWQRGTGSGGLRPIAVGGGMVVVSKAGSRGGLVAFEHDPAGHLVSIVSPTRLNLGRSLLHYGEGFAVVAAVALLLSYAMGRVRRRRDRPAEEPA
jgi:outer membrane protein assembly factor BamB